MTNTLTSGSETYTLAHELETLGFKPNEIEGNILYFKKKTRVLFYGKDYWVKKGKRDAVASRTLHELVETLTSIGV